MKVDITGIIITYQFLKKAYQCQILIGIFRMFEGKRVDRIRRTL